MSTDVSHSQLTAAKALAAIVALLVLSLVLPPTLATWVADARVDRARSEAEAIRAGMTDGSQSGSAVVLAGSGRLPKTGSPATLAWLSDPRGSLTAQPDPWGNAYLVLLGRTHADSAGASADRVFPVLVLSAGPNGVIETPFDTAANRGGGGDDVVAGVRSGVPLS